MHGMGFGRAELPFPSFFLSLLILDRCYLYFLACCFFCYHLMCCFLSEVCKLLALVTKLHQNLSNHFKTTEYVYKVKVLCYGAAFMRMSDDDQ